jgi:hypothetical protein
VAKRGRTARRRAVDLAAARLVVRWRVRELSALRDVARRLMMVARAAPE